VTDWLGNVWLEGTFPALPAEGWRGPLTPDEGDGFRAGPLEWGSFAMAAQLASRGACRLVRVERPTVHGVHRG